MDRRYIDDHHVVARYLANRVSDEERIAFEAYYLEHPEMVQEMEAAARFKVGLYRLRETGELAQLLKSKPRHLQWQFVAAAAAVTALIVGGIYELTRPTATQSDVLTASVQALRIPNGKLPVIAGAYEVFRSRGNPIDTQIPAATDAQAIELRVLPEFTAEPPRYRVQLSRMDVDDSLKTVGELGGLVPAPDRFVSVFLSGALLSPGRYQLTISGDTGTDAASTQSEFVIRVAPRP